MPKKPNKDNPKCPICSNISVKNGIKRMRLRAYQRFLCKHCNRYLTLQPPQQKSKTYNLKTILDAISAYNLGTPLRKTNLKRSVFPKFFLVFPKSSSKTNNFGFETTKIPKSTIHNWIKNINLPMNRLRDKLKGIPNHEIIKKQRFIHHNQPFLY